MSNTRRRFLYFRLEFFRKSFDYYLFNLFNSPNDKKNIVNISLLGMGNLLLFKGSTYLMYFIRFSCCFLMILNKNFEFVSILRVFGYEFINCARRDSCRKCFWKNLNFMRRKEKCRHLPWWWHLLFEKRVLWRDGNSTTWPPVIQGRKRSMPFSDRLDSFLSCFFS